LGSPAARPGDFKGLAVSFGDSDGNVVVKENCR
jgi:hypothetical protein